MRIVKFFLWLIFVSGVLFTFLSCGNLHSSLAPSQSFHMSSPQVTLQHQNSIVVRNPDELANALEPLNLSEREREDVLATAHFEERGFHSFMTFYISNAGSASLRASVLELRAIDSGAIELTTRVIAARANIRAQETITTISTDDDFWGDTNTHISHHVKNRGLNSAEIDYVNNKLKDAILNSPIYNQIKQGQLRRR